MSQQSINRYLSFQGIGCDEKAHRLMSCIEQYTENPPHSSSWSKYFQVKLSNSLALGQDELFLVCSQMNNIRALFEEYEDAEALELLECVEEDCC